MILRISSILLLVVLYLLGAYFSGLAGKPDWILPALMGLVFLALVSAMYLRLLPALLALPILAVALVSIAGMNWKDILSAVVQDGSIRLSIWIIAAILGSILAQIVEKTGIAQTAIKKTAELGGDRPMVLAVLLTIVIAILFTTLGGLGAVIMVATIVIPILLSLGLRPLYVSCVFLLAMSLGGAFNLVNWQFYQDALKLSQEQILSFATPFAIMMLVTTLVFLAIEGKRLGKAHYKAVVAEQPSHPFVPWYALLTPIVPLIPVLVFALLPKGDNKTAYDFPITAALLLGILYGAIATFRKGQSVIQLITKSTFDGIAAVGPAVALMVGIGMVLNATRSSQVSGIITPILAQIIPRQHAGTGTMIHYILLFTILAPLALYRGPLNLYGMGAGLIETLKTLMPPGAIMGAFTTVGMIQGVCDPTNTHNVWIANYTNTDVQDILKRTLPYMWILTLAGLILSAFLYYG